MASLTIIILMTRGVIYAPKSSITLLESSITLLELSIMFLESSITLLESSVMLLKNVYSTSSLTIVTYDHQDIFMQGKLKGEVSLYH